MCVLVKGTWIARTFIPEDKAVYANGILNIQRFILAFTELHSQYDNDWDISLDQLGVLRGIPDTSFWIDSYNTAVFTSEKNFTVKHYNAYINLLSILRHTMTDGDMLWNNRTVLLDTSVAQDWLVGAVVK